MTAMKVIQGILYLTVVIHLVHCRPAIRSMHNRDVTECSCDDNSPIHTEMGKFSTTFTNIIDQTGSDEEMVI